MKGAAWTHPVFSIVLSIRPSLEHACLNLAASSARLDYYIEPKVIIESWPEVAASCQ